MKRNRTLTKKLGNTLTKRWWIVLIIAIIYLLWMNPGWLPIIGAGMAYVMRLLFAMSFMIIQFVALFWFIARSRTIIIRPGDPKSVTFDDYHGQPQLVAMVKQWLSLLDDREKFQKMGGKFINGLLLYGGPGTGKSYLAKAMAGSAGVGFISVEGSSFRGMFMGPQPLSSKILTPDGWTTMGEICVGNLVINRHGNPVAVVGVFDQGKQDIYKITLKDGREVRASKDHRWIVRNHASRKKYLGKETVRTTLELKTGYTADAIPHPSPIKGTKIDFIIPPYAMGALLGNGSTTISINKLSHQKVETELKKLGLYGKKSHTKFIPEIYLRATIKQRLSLLNGLIDTNGHISHAAYYIHYTTISPQLRDGIIELARSLGGYATWKESGRQSFEIVLDLGTTMTNIKSVAFDGQEPTRCIAIDDPDHLYITDDYILTHNTDTLKVISFVKKARKLAREYGACLAFIDEIDAVGASRGGVMDNRGMSGRLGVMMGGGMMGASGALTRLLYEMDGVDEKTRREKWQARIYRLMGKEPPPRDWHVLFMGSTNRPDVLDPALTRPGRFDSKIEVSAPDKTGRRAIVDYYLSKITTDNSVNVEAIVEDTVWATPAKIMAAITKDAVRIALFDGRDAVSQSDIDQAFQEQAFGLEKPIEEMQDDQREQIAYHEAGHAIAFHYYRPEHRIVRATIVGRSGALGYVQPVPKYEEYVIPLRILVADVMVSLAGHVATKVFLGEYWSGAYSDFRKVRGKIQHLATLGYFGPPVWDNKPPIDEMKKFWTAIEEQCETFIREHKEETKAIALALLEKQSLTGDEVVKIINENRAS